MAAHLKQMKEGRPVASSATTKAHEKPTKTRKDKFLKYGTTSGWSNQIISLEHAYWLAAATNRTLVLAPIMSHFETIQWTYMKESMDKIYQSKKDNPLMTSILNFSMSQVNVLDYQDYYQRVLSKRKLTDIQLTWPVDSKTIQHHMQYRCDNTIWTLDSNLHGKQTTNRCMQHIGMQRKAEDNQEPHKDVLYRHPRNELVEQFDHYDVWTFNFLYPESLFDRLSFENPANQPLPFHYKYVDPIVQAARTIYSQWNIAGQDDSVRRYFSLHFRGSDGPYQKTQWPEIMRDTLNGAKQALLKDFSEQQSSGRPSSDIEYVILLVTDMKELIQMKDDNKKLVKLWKDNVQRITRELKDASSSSSKLSIRYVTPGSYQKEAGALSQQLQNEHAPIFLDQQLAACAGLGFNGSHLSESSFQRRIQQMHLQEGLEC